MVSARTLLVLASCLQTGEGSGVKSMANPIRRVVTMLQMMIKKVEGEGKVEEDLFEKFMCYCKTGKGTLERSIASAKNTNEQLTSSIKET